MLAAANSVLACWYIFLEPRFSFHNRPPAARINLVLFFLVGGVIGIFVGQMRRALSAAMGSEKRFRNLFESMDEGFVSAEMIYDTAGKPADFRYLAVNQAFARQTGLRVELVVGKTIKEIIPDVEPFWSETYGRVVQTGQSERFSYPMAALGREFEVFAWRSVPGQFAAVFSDVTARKRADSDLRRLAGIIESTDEAIAGEDLNGSVTSWNPAAERLLGTLPRKCLGSRLPGYSRRTGRNCQASEHRSSSIPGPSVSRGYA